MQLLFGWPLDIAVWKSTRYRRSKKLFEKEIILQNLYNAFANEHTVN